MACPCCGPVWVCADCCCPDGSAPPSSVTITISNQRFCDQDDVGGERSSGRFYAPADLYKAISIEGAYTLSQDIFGAFKRLDARTNRVIEGPSAQNCVHYSNSQGGSVKMTAGRWPPEAGTFYWLYFASGGYTMETLITGGGNYDICTGIGRQPDGVAPFLLYRNGAAVTVTGGGRPWFVYVCADVTISR